MYVILGWLLIGFLGALLARFTKFSSGLSLLSWIMFSVGGPMVWAFMCIDFLEWLLFKLDQIEL
jgi:hypothetical protein